MGGAMRRKLGSRPLPVWANEGDGLDPMRGVANLFDLAMVFALALMVALVLSLSPSLLDPSAEVVTVVNPGTPQMEMIHKKGSKLERYRSSKQRAKGDGTKLGTAYRLDNGEVVYVPASGED